MIAGYEINQPVSEIAETLNRTAGAVRGRATALGISKALFNTDKTDIGFENETSCKHCGQMNILNDECDCPGAKHDRKIRDQIIRACESIEEIFGKDCVKSGYTPISDDNIDLLYAAVEQIAKYKMHAVSFVLSTGTRAKLTRGSKGAIKVERSETKKLASEVEE